MVNSLFTDVFSNAAAPILKRVYDRDVHRKSQWCGGLQPVTPRTAPTSANGTSADTIRLDVCIPLNVVSRLFIVFIAVPVSSLCSHCRRVLAIRPQELYPLGVSCNSRQTLFLGLDQQE